MNQEVKRHLISALYTFVTGFILVVGPMLSELSVESIEKGALVGIIIAGLRSGLKLLGESLIGKVQ